jgi:aryl-alcohol dehydrogenase-like predicted oxidoreductase
MSKFSRRDFLASMTAAAGAVAFSGQTTYADEASATTTTTATASRKIIRGTDVVKFGRTDLKPTLLGLGTGTVSGSQQRAMGQDGFTKLFRHALDRGIRYIDTADSYKTHSFVAKALDGVPRDKYYIQSKTFAKKPEKAKEDLERFLKELKTDYIDSLLMHCMTKASWPTDMRAVQEVLLEAKKKGQIRALGISCHGWDPLAASPDAKDIDVQLARINPFDKVMDGPHEKVAEVLKKMHDAGRGIIGMKIFGENGLGGREQRLQSLKYVLGLGCVDCFPIGFTSIPQLDETLELIEMAQA